VAPAVGVDQGQLRAGVSALAPDEKPRALPPSAEVEQAGQLRDVGLARTGGVIADGLPVLADRGNPRIIGEPGDRLAYLGVQVVPDREAHLSIAAEVDELVHARGGVPADEQLLGHAALG